MIQQSALESILGNIEGTNYKDVESMELLKDYAFRLKQWMSFSASQMVECKEALHKARRQAMVNLIGTLEANKTQMPVSLMKEYVDDLCAKENAVFMLAERCNKTCTHALDLLRTMISALKEELMMANR